MLRQGSLNFFFLRLCLKYVFCEYIKILELFLFQNQEKSISDEITPNFVNYLINFLFS